MSSSLTCRDEARRQRIREKPSNGIDYVDGDGAHLCVHFITGIPDEFQVKSDEEKHEALKKIEIRGGRRITNIHATGFDAHATDDNYDEDCLGIDLDREGDWSTYTLCFIDIKSLDPRYACVDFTFKLDCPAEVDCKTETACPVEEQHPAINYLAKDYASFRRLILDRLSLLMPDWRERHVPDVGIAIVEVMAYVADYLSYYQDAVATEAYLDTARQRISVRRHARLVDYRMHDGCNARVFLFIEALSDAPLTLADIYFTTDSTPPLAFEPLSGGHSSGGTGALACAESTGEGACPPMNLVVAHNEIGIYTWGDRECCIPKGATRATLIDGYGSADVPSAAVGRPARSQKYEPPPPPEPKRKLKLAAGDFLLFEELACAGTVRVSHDDESAIERDAQSLRAGRPRSFDDHTPQPDVDRTHRHVVRLTKVTQNIDPLNDQAVLEVEWSREDAMPFMLCVSAVGGPPDCDYVEPLAVARGNVLLCDHGLTESQPLDPIEPEDIEEVCDGEDELSDVPIIARRYRPPLKDAPLTFAQPLIGDASASSLLTQEPRAAVAAVTLTSSSDSTATCAQRPVDWYPVYDLLNSGPDDAEFVAEIDDVGRAHLRFGDGDTGRAVEIGMSFTATYRTGNGRAGLVGAETIVRVVWRKNPVENLIQRVRNPLPSGGAVDPEPVAEVKMYAPAAFRSDLQRAITATDYATLARYTRFPIRNPRVQNAAGSLVWSGSWYEANVGIDEFGTAKLEEVLRTSVMSSLERYRRMGHDLRVDNARSVPLRLELDLCIKEHYLRAHVLVAIREAIQKFFSPDNVTFGEAVYVSRIVAVVMAVDGVNEVEVVRLERIAQRESGPPLAAPSSAGILRLRPNEIARLDHDPAQPENGFLTFRNVRGGR